MGTKLNQKSYDVEYKAQAVKLSQENRNILESKKNKIKLWTNLKLKNI